MALRLFSSKIFRSTRNNLLTINFSPMDSEDEDKTLDPDLMEEASPDLGDSEEVDLL